MTERSTAGVAGTIHDAIDEVTTTVENIHRSIAELPFEVLGNVAPLTETIQEARSLHAQSVGAVYGLIRRVNDQVRQLTTGATAR